MKNLIESCEKWDIAYHIEAIDCFGSWELNCSYKPFFLLSKLQEFKRPIFWVDADAVFLRAPAVLPEFSADLAVRINDTCPAEHRSKVMSGSIFVNMTPEAAKVLKLWASACYQTLSNPDRKEEYFDQIGLRDAIFSGTHGATVARLPHAYVAVEGHPVDQKEILEPVILHYQASRRYKKLINNV
ncbi:MAG TPA: putative nucleotide-diphospho-sugar transferase [Rhabdochlamydiaceae bacterium]